ncbi:MAG: hypothetical protein LCH85_00375 [Chloroflexi bacterium]|nr:hypothetical protein [Chloroflexota bacterium]
MRWLNTLTPWRIVGLLTLLCLGLAGLARSPQAQPTSADPIQRAWQLAQISGSYRYSIDLAQTTTAAPSLANAGANPQRSERLSINGAIDQAADRMEMTIANNAEQNVSNSFALKIEQGRSFGRYGTGNWQPIEQSSDLFAPAGDPLGFLAGLEQVTSLGKETRSVGTLRLEFQHYRFNFNGEQFANYLQPKLEAQLRQRGELPAGMSLDTSTSYAQMSGTGEVWLDQHGLPSRLSLNLNLPAQADGSNVSATIRSDFFDFDQRRLALASSSFWQQPDRWLGYRLDQAQRQLQPLAQIALIPCLEILLLALAVAFWRKRRTQTIMAASVISAMLITPMLQAENVAATRSKQLAKQAEQTEQQAQAELQQQAITKTQNLWQPNTKPEAQTLSPKQLASNGSDSDGDGLSDADEDDWYSCATIGSSTGYCAGVSNAKDYDGDGLSDGAEVNQLGTLPRNSDSDGDSIPDGLEVKGFRYQGQQWYLDPLSNDSNQDGLLDSVDCGIWSQTSNAYNPNATCPDTDGDGQPDLFDRDNDNDGINDDVDLSPNLLSNAVFDDQNPLKLQIDNLKTNRPVFVDFQLRPTDLEHLSYSSRILDWPANDNQGQIQRVLDTTFATSTNSDIRINAINADYGDVMMVPMLEITMPYSTGHYANLPITTTYQNNQRQLGVGVEQWLDSSELDPYGITVRDLDTNSGNLLAYVPVVRVSNSMGGNPAAFAARMLYYPEQGSNGTANWGAAQQVRLVWLVQMITDECVDAEADPSTCARQENLSIVQIYDETWSLAGMSVSEDHGAKTAIMYEQPSSDSNLQLDDELWMVAWNLNNTFIRGRDCDTLNGTTCQGNGQRDVRINNLASQIANWSSNSSNVAVQTSNFLHEGYVSQVSMQQIRDLLETQFNSYSSQTNPSLLIAQEKSNRSLNLQDGAGLSNGLARFDLNPNTIKLTTIAGMSWATYQFINGAWQNYAVDDYLTLLETTLRTNQTFIQNEVGEELSGKLIWAQLFYASINQGFLGLAEIDNVPVWKPSADALTEQDYQATWFVNPSPSGGHGFAATANLYAEQLQKVYKNLRKAQSTANKWAKFDRTLSHDKIDPTTLQGLKTVRAATNYAIGVSIGLTLLGGTLLLIGLTTNNAALIKTSQIILTAASMLLVVTRITMIVSQMTAVVRAGSTLISTLSMLQSVAKANRSLGTVNLVIALTMIWGVFIFQLASGQFSWGSHSANLALAQAIAATIMIFVMLVIAFIPIIGPLIVAIISLVDLILRLFNIRGFSDWMSQFIADQLYEANNLLDNLSDPNRLKITSKTIDLLYPELGFVRSNALSMTFAVTNTLKYNDHFDVGDARRSTFRYWLQTSATDQHAALDQNQMRNEWDAIGNRQIQTSTEISLPQALPFSDVGTGINRSLDQQLFITEASVAPYEGCWLLVTFEVDCTWYDTKGSSHSNIGEFQYFDILPDTIEQFANLDWNMNPDLRFNQIKDADGDGLISQALGGVDPDDTRFDSDNDGLSDYVELSNGTNPQNADSDQDQLSDFEEHAYHSNPLNRDSDSDGLVDYVEFKQGWLVAYSDLSSTQTKLARIWSGNSSDADNDSLSDLEEYTFGFNPWVATDPSLIDNLVEIERLTVNEQNAPRLLAQFGEREQSQAFADSSGANHTLRCSPSQCPSLAIGRYANGVKFDGTNDQLNSNVGMLELAQASFTLAAWVKTTSTKQAIITKNDGDSTWERGEKSFYINANGQPTFVGFGNNYITSNQSVNDDRWHHVAVEWDYPNLTGTIYIDGVDRTNRASTNYRSNNRDNANDTLKVGRNNSNSNEAANNFKGLLDEVAVFDRTLGTAQINDLMQGRYNPNDRLLAPGAALSYQATISNTLPAQSVNGQLTASNQTSDPDLANPNIALRMETLDRQQSYRNSASSNETASCLGQRCPTSELLGGRDYAVRFDGVDDQLIIPMQLDADIATGEMLRSLKFSIKLEQLPAAGQTATIYSSVVSATSDLQLAINSAGNLVISVGGSTSSSYYNGSTTDSTWRKPHYSVYSFANNLNTWVEVQLDYRNFSDTTGRTTLSINGTQDSRLDYSYWPRLNIGNARLGANAISKAFQGSLGYLWATNEKNVRLLDLNFNEDYGYTGNYYHNTAGNQQALSCGTSSTCPSYLLQGYNGQAIRLDGNDDYLNLPNNASFTPGERTLRMAVKLEQLPASGQVVSLLDTVCANSNSYCLDLTINSSGQLVMHISPGTTLTSSTIFSQANLNTWVQLEFDFVIGFNSSSRSSVMVYANGSLVLIDSQFSIGPLELAPSRIGRSVANTNPLKASIDDLFIQGSYNLSFDAPPFDSEMRNHVNQARVASCEFVLTCPAFEQNGRYDQALSFDGLNDSLLLDRSISEDFSVGFWLRSNQTSGAASNWWQGAGLIDANVLSPSNDFGISLGNNGQVMFGLGNSNGTSTTIKTGAVNDNQWHHVVATRHKQTGAIKLYLDGTLTISGTGHLNRLDIPHLRIGAALNNSNFYQGQLDELVVIPAVIERDAVQFLMQSTYPAIKIDADFAPFHLPAQTSMVVSSTTQVNANIISSQQRFEQAAEAAIALQQNIGYPVTDLNANKLPIFLPFEDVPGSQIFKNVGNVSYWSNLGYDKTNLDCSNPDCPSAGLRGYVERAAYFDGNGDHLRFSDQCCSPEATTIAAWVNGNSGTIVDLRNPNNATGLRLAYDNFLITIDLDGSTASGGNASFVVPFELPEGQWSHVVANYDKANQLATVYINGQLAASTALPGANGTHANMSSQFPTIGANQGDGGDFYRGYLDDLRIYQVVLSASQIQTLYTTSAPMLKFEFDEEQNASEFHDRSQSGYLGKPITTQCATLDLESIRANQLATSPSTLYVDKANDRLASIRLNTQVTQPLSASSVLCAGDQLSVGLINSNGSTSLIANKTIDVKAVGNGSAIFQQGSNRITLRWTIDDQPLYRHNPAPGTDGKIGRTVLFDGKGAIQVDQANAINNLQNQFTILAWVKPDTITDTTSLQRFIAAGRDNSVNGFGFGLSGSALNFGIFGGFKYSSSATVAPRVWQQVAVVFDASNDAKFYLDGEYIDTIAGSSAVPINNDDPLFIGASTDQQGLFNDQFRGQLDELTIYQRELSTAEIYNLYLRDLRWYRARSTSYLTIDNDQPIVSLLASNNYRANAPFQLAVSATDPSSSIRLVDMGVRGPNASTYEWTSVAVCAEAQANNAAWCPVIDPSKFGGAGSYQVIFRAVDAVGHETTSATTTLYVDGAGPTATLEHNQNWRALQPVANHELQWTLALSGTISDPQFGNGIAGSGLEQTKVLIGLFDQQNRLIGSESWQQAQVVGERWSIEYHISGSRPSGSYRVEMSAVDQVGNQLTTALRANQQQTLLLDARPPSVDLFQTIAATPLMSETWQISGTLNELPSWHGAVASYHFETAAARNDSSGNNYHASCDACPSSATGQFGMAASFNPANQQRLTVAATASLNLSQASFSAWIKPNWNSSSGSAYSILALADSSNTRYNWQVASDYRSIRLFNGSTTSSISATITPNQWQHVALVQTGSEWTAYLNGTNLGSVEQSFGTASNLPLQIGSAKPNSGFFNGQLDEVQIYQRALSAREIYGLAQSEHAGVNQAQIWLEAYHFDGSPSSEIWQSAPIQAQGTDLATWSYNPPAASEGFYQLHVRGNDAFANTNDERIIWRGSIDTQAPRVSINATQGGSGANSYTDYVISAEDLFIDENSLLSPCAGSPISYGYYPNPARINRLSVSCRVNGHSQSVVIAKACDYAGHCSTSSVDPLPTPTPTATAIPSSTPIASATPTASATAIPSATPSATTVPSVTATGVPSATPTAIATTTATASATAIASLTATATATLTATPTKTATATVTATATTTPTKTATATAVPPITPSPTPTIVLWYFPWVTVQ